MSVLEEEMTKDIYSYDSGDEKLDDHIYGVNDPILSQEFQNTIEKPNRNEAKMKLKPRMPGQVSSLRTEDSLNFAFAEKSVRVNAKTVNIFLFVGM